MREALRRPIAFFGDLAGHRRSARVLPRVSRVLVGVLVLCALMAPPAMASIQLSEGLPFSSVNFESTLPQISPNGQYAVYKQDAVTNNANELWSVRMDGGSAPIRLSDVLTPGRLLRFAISPDSSRVVYVVDQDVDEKFEIFSVAIGGGVSTKLNSNLGFDRDVAGFAISSTSDRVFYVADAIVDQRYELYSVPVAGGTATRLNHDLSADFDVGAFQVSPDGQNVVYRAGSDAINQWELFSVPAEGPREEAVKISQDLATGMSVLPYFRITPDSDTVLYLADVNVDETYELFRTGIRGPAETQPISNGPAAGHSVDQGFHITNNGSWVVYRAGTISAQVYQLFSSPVSPGTTVRLNGTLGSDEDVEEGFAVSDNGSRVVYRSDEDVNDVVDIYSVPVGGGAPTRLNPAMTPNGDVQTLAISPDSARVIYIADVTIDTLDELYSVPIAGGSVTKLNRTLAAGGDVQNFIISADSGRVVYGADQDADTVDVLLAVPIAGGSVLDVNGPLVSGGDVTLEVVETIAYQISAANSGDVLYAADEVFDGEVELYVSSLVGPPGFPTSVVATPGDTEATVTFAAPDNNGGSPITGYTVTPLPATPGWVDSNADSTVLTHVITGLVNGTAYTFTVRATNIYGIGDPSAPSNSVTPATTPGAPTGAIAVARNFSAEITFAAPVDNGGSAITGYTVVSNPPGGIDLNQGTTGLKHLVVGLINGASYTFTVTAQNAIGSGPPSAPTSSVTPGCSNVVPANVFCDGLESNGTSNWSLTLPGAPSSPVF